MSIALQNEVNDLKRRVAALEALVMGQQHKDDAQPIVPKELIGKTLTLPEKRKSA